MMEKLVAEGLLWLGVVAAPTVAVLVAATLLRFRQSPEWYQ